MVRGPRPSDLWSKPCSKALGPADPWGGSWSSCRSGQTIWISGSRGCDYRHWCQFHCIFGGWFALTKLAEVWHQTDVLYRDAFSGDWTWNLFEGNTCIVWPVCQDGFLAESWFGRLQAFHSRSFAGNHCHSGSTVHGVNSTVCHFRSWRWHLGIQSFFGRGQIARLASLRPQPDDSFRGAWQRAAVRTSRYRKGHRWTLCVNSTATPSARRCLG